MNKLFAVCSLIAAISMPAIAADEAKGSLDPLTVAPNMYKKVYENEKVRVLEVTFQPGQKIAKHSHPDHYAYVVTPGKLKISKPDGTSNDADLQSGQVMWIPAETHWAENTGTTPVKLVVNEFKDSKSGAATQKKAQ